MSTFVIELFTAIGVYTFVFIAYILYEGEKEWSASRLEAWSAESDQVFTAPETGMYAVTSSLGGGVNIIECDGNTSYNITYTTSSVEDKVFYDKETDTIIDGNSLVELGDL